MALPESGVDSYGWSKQDEHLRSDWRLVPFRWRCPSPACRRPLSVNGARGAVIDGFANQQRCKKGAGVAASFFRRVYGEKCR